jgi:hypothetical protein
MHRYILLLYACVVSFVKCYSQKAGQVTYPRLYWGVSVTPALMAKANIQGDKSRYNLSSTPQFGAEVVINSYYHFERLYSFVVGIGGGTIAYNFDYNIDKNKFEPPTGSDISINGVASREAGIFYFKLPVELEKKWLNQTHGDWNLAAGGSLLYAPKRSGQRADVILLPDGQQVEYLTIDQNNYNNNGKPWFNFHISGGHDWTLRKGNLFRLNLKVNYSATDFVTAAYRFNVGNQPAVSGRYGITGTYVGICLSYIFFSQ